MQGDPGGDGQQQQFSDEFKLLDVTSTDGSAAAIQQSFQHDPSAQVIAADANGSCCSLWCR